MATQSATLTVAWRTGKTHARQVKAAENVLAYLGQIAESADELIKAGEGGDYDPDDEQGERDYLRVDPEDMLDASLATEMMLGPSLPPISADDLQQRRMVGYGLVVGNDPANRRLYLKRRNPVSLLSKSLVTRFSGTLARIEDPVLAFEDRFDVVIQGDDVWALDQAAFEGLFKETDAVLALVDDWVEDLAGRIPLAGPSSDALVGFARRNGVLRRKLHSVLRRNHIQNLGADELRQALSDHGLDVQKLLPNDELLLENSAEATAVIAMLNEDFFNGYFSSEGWSASRKALRH